MLRRLIDSKFNLKAEGLTVKRIIEIINASQTVVCDISEEAGKKVTSVDSQAMSAMDLLSLLTQSLDLDFMVKGTGVWVDTREAIDKLVPKSK